MASAASFIASVLAPETPASGGRRPNKPFVELIDRSAGEGFNFDVDQTVLDEPIVRRPRLDGRPPDALIEAGYPWEPKAKWKALKRLTRRRRGHPLKQELDRAEGEGFARPKH